MQLGGRLFVGQGRAGLHRQVFLVVSLVAWAVALPGCAAINKMLSPKKKTTASVHDEAVCDSSNSAVFDLGTGKAVDVRRTSPRFYSMRPEGHTRSRQTFSSAEQEANSRARMNRETKTKIDALHRGIQEGAFAVEPVIVDDIDVVNLVPASGSTPMRIHAWTYGQQVILFRVVPGECPHVFTKNLCQDGELVSQPYVKGTVACLGDISVERDDIWIQIDGERPTATKMGELAAVEYPPRNYQERTLRTHIPLSVSLRLPNDPVAIWAGEVVVNDYSGAQPDDVLALAVSGRLDHLVGMTFISLDPAAITDEFRDKLVELRVKGAEVFGGKAARDAATLVEYLATLGVGLGVPGDKEIAEALSPLFQQLLSKLTRQGDFDALMNGTALVQAMRKMGAPQVQDVEDFEKHFGAGIADGTTTNKQAIRAFTETSPESSFVAIQQERAHQEAQVRAEARQEERRQAEIDEAWYQVQIVADEIATLRHNWLWLLKNYGSDPREKLAATRMQNHEGALFRERYCPSRRDFLAVSSKADLKRRVAAHCQNEPPLGHSLGAQVRLVDGCRQVFRRSCQ